MRKAIAAISAPTLGGVVPPSNFRMRLPNGGGDIQLMTQLVRSRPESGLKIRFRSRTIGSGERAFRSAIARPCLDP
jgi:hypothetical protein